MKILILMRNSIHSSRGGAEVQAEYIRNTCANAGHEVHFAFDLNEEIGIDDPGTHYHFLPDRGRLKAYLNYFALSRLIRKIQPDLIYQRVRFSYTGMAAYLAKRNNALFVHGISADYACRKNKIPFTRSFFSSLLTEILGRYGILKADLIISQTNTQARMLKDTFGLDSIVIPNGHEVPAPPFRKDRPALVAWVANIKPWKQPDLFIELARRLGDTNAVFIMAGSPHSGPYNKWILNKINRTKNLEYLGLLSQDDVNSLLSRASVFVNTSQPREGFPNTFIQAWMRQTPVVTLNFDPGGINREQGAGFHSKNFEQLVKDVRRLIDGEDLGKKMGQQARTYSIQAHDIEVVGTRYLNAFNCLFRRQGGASQ